MSDPIKTLVTYRLERARETLEEAQLLLASGHVNTYVNRLYYACFYAVSAYLLSQDKISAKHSGVRALFHQQVVKPGLVNGCLALYVPPKALRRLKVIVNYPLNSTVISV